MTERKGETTVDETKHPKIEFNLEIWYSHKRVKWRAKLIQEGYGSVTESGKTPLDALTNALLAYDEGWLG